MTLAPPESVVPDDLPVQFQAAVKKYVQGKGKTKKTRPKKQPRLAPEHVAATTSAAPDMEAILRCTWALQEPLNMEPLPSTTLVGVMSATMTCLFETHQAIPLASLVGAKDGDVAIPPRTRIQAANGHPIYRVLLGIARRCVSMVWCRPDAESTFSDLMTMLMTWIEADGTTWAWLLAFLGTNATRPLLEYTLRTIATHGAQTSPSLLANLTTFLVPTYPLYIAPAVVAVVATASDEHLCLLLSVLRECPQLVLACDQHFSTAPADTLQRRLASPDVRRHLLDLCTARAAELVRTPVQVIVALESLGPECPFHAEYLAYLPTNALFFRRTIESLAHLVTTLPANDAPSSFHVYFWPLVARHGSAAQIREVCSALLHLPSGLARCQQLLPHLPPASIASMLDLLASQLSAAHPHQTQRALRGFIALVPPSADVEEPAAHSIVGQLDALAAWKASSGVAHWHAVLAQARSAEDATSDLALSVLESLPYPTLEDPIWQYTCIYALLQLFFRRLGKERPVASLTRVLSRIIADGGGVAAYPASVATTFTCLFVDAILSAHAPTTIAHNVPPELNFFQPDDRPVSDAGHVFRKLSAANTLRPYDPFPVDSTTKDASREVSTTVLAQLQLGRAKWVDAALPAPSTYDATLQGLHKEKMAAAVACGIEAKALLLATQPDWSGLVDLLVERMLPVAVFMPADEQYRDVLPERTNFDVDLRMEQWLLHYPFVVSLLECIVAYGPPHAVLRCLPLLKSLLVVLINYWHARRHQRLDDVQDDGTPPYLHMSHMLAVTLEVMAVIAQTQWIPEPLQGCGTLFPRLTPLDIRSILHALWLYLSDHPPTRHARENGNMEYYLMPLQHAVHRNMAAIGPLYAQFALH
ncbi:hypothetical protein SDRG_05811 [Saprolegnia diclina VS20]|uniref:Integrator complex subunit 5 C-terminal domain-containing protein n=1 Tax=Saprolegnia diclina (strain VS20) TaxID=1156394 RepID=T0S2X4_SAPDV|nr:hypothetical protein SDRG_05811 [Saprolegnia diclina VS20]EQC36992.1 hypothetical protein SDRG_05811 [Saprolegnia diclina VS20]|eukprot:XP_008609774.1 hypothetical protein SDRG_05811 [Saprolegnia diclina VS20]